MLGVDMFPSLTVGPQRIGDCLYREREAPSNIQLFPPVCDVAPRLLGPPPVPVKPISKPQQDHVKMELENSSLWKQFSSVGTEMIITKKGRRMFPGLKLKLSGLNPSLRYILLLDIVPVDNSRYRFQGGGWQAIGGAEARLPDRAFIHPDSPATGEHWQSRSISFHSAKLTNNTLDTQGHIILHSMHRYQPRIHLIEAGDVLRRGGGQHTFVFPETQFITVTAYQNNKITELKINSNPFAKGFRDDGMNSKRQRDARQKRKLANLTETLDIVNCDECESSESATTSSDLQTLALHSLLPDTSCGFRPEDVSYQVPEQSLDYGQPFMTSQMSNISISMSNEMQETPGNEGTNDMIEGSATMIEATYESDFSAVQSNSSSFPSAPLPQSSPSFSMLPDPSHPLSSFPPVVYPSLIPATPSLQQTSFTFPTPPLSDSSSPQLSPSSPAPSNTYTSETATSHASTSFHTPSNTYQATLQDPVSSDSPQTPSSQLLQGDPLTTAAFIYPNLLTTHTDPAPAVAQTPINQHQQPSSTISASNSLSFPSVPPHIQSLSLPSVSPSPALNLPNLSHQAAASFPPPSFSHSSTSFHHLSFPPSSCLQQCVTPAAPQNLPNPSTSSYTCPYPPVEISAIHQFNPAASYRPEMVLHSQNLLPRLPSSTPPSALYPTFPSYPLHLHQDPHSSLSNPFRHLYRQPQHGNHPSQGSFISTRAVF